MNETSRHTCTATAPSKAGVSTFPFYFMTKAPGLHPFILQHQLQDKCDPHPDKHSTRDQKISPVHASEDYMALHSTWQLTEKLFSYVRLKQARCCLMMYSYQISDQVTFLLNIYFSLCCSLHYSTLLLVRISAVSHQVHRHFHCSPDSYQGHV